MAVQHVDDLPARQGGGKCGDVWADELIGAMSTGGAVDFVDGVEFDVPFKQPQLNGRSRSADCNADGIPDNGVVGGVPVFAIGYDAFLKRLRLGLPDKLIMADAGEEKHQRSLRWLNGIEIEGWPKPGDMNLVKWSSGLNSGTLLRRIGEHQAGRVKSTEHRRPMELIHYEAGFFFGWTCWLLFLITPDIW